MDPRIKVIYIRQLKDGIPKNSKASIVPSRLKEWPGHSMYTNKEILDCLKLGIRWNSR